MASKKVKSPAEFVWNSLGLTVKQSASLQDISNLLCESGYENIHDSIIAYLSIYDRNDDGFISFKDFQTISSPDFDPFANDETLSSIFAGFDKQQVGGISPKDLVEVAKEVSEPVTEEEAESMVNAFDTDGDGVIDLKEFKAIVKTKR
jgi:Ca2+-binding EF-hand superfamily protein